jgi:heterotetrameric sarcosine oxidase delta subunit
VIRISCPNCGPRNSTEFTNLGEIKTRPASESVTKLEWRSFLYFKNNPLGWTTEQWYHSSGCRKFLIAERHTLTNEIRAIRLANQPGTTS